MLGDLAKASIGHIAPNGPMSRRAQVLACVWPHPLQIFAIKKTLCQNLPGGQDG